MPTSSLATRGARAIVTLVVCGLLGLLGASAAHAHNVLRSTDPVDGSTVAVVPSQVTLTFDAAAMALGTELMITNPAGAVVSTEPAQLIDANVTQPLSGDLPAGLYTVQWRVTSEDAHPIEGSFTFTAAASATPESDAETPSIVEPTPDASESSVAPPAPAPAASSDVAVSDEQSSGGAISAGLLFAIGGGVLLAGVVVAVLLWRRRPPSSPDE